MFPNRKIVPPPSGTATYSLGAFRLDRNNVSRAEQTKPTRPAEGRSSFIEDAARRVYDLARTSAQHLSTLCDLDEDHCLRLIFQRGAFLLPTLQQPEEPLSSCQFSRCNLVDDESDSAQHRAEFQQELRQLPIPQQALLRTFVQEGCNSNLTLSRAKPCDRAQHVNDLLTLIKCLILYLKCRCGIEGFLCVVRDNTEYELPPQWFFTSPEIDSFLAATFPMWDTNVIALKLQEFGIAGCDILPYIPSKDHATWSRKEVLRKLHLAYATAAGQPSAMLPLTSIQKYTKEVAVLRGLELIGWPFPTLVPVPTIPYDLGSLRILLSALQNNECYFRNIAPEILMEIRGEYYEPLLAQTVRSTQEQESRVTSGKPAFTTPNRKAKWFHLNSPAEEGGSGSKRCRRD